MVPKVKADGRLQAVEVNMQLGLAAAHARVHQPEQPAVSGIRPPSASAIKAAELQSGLPVTACIGVLQDRALDALDLLDGTSTPLGSPPQPASGGRRFRRVITKPRPCHCLRHARAAGARRPCRPAGSCCGQEPCRQHLHSISGPAVCDGRSVRAGLLRCKRDSWSCRRARPCGSPPIRA